MVILNSYSGYKYNVFSRDEKDNKSIQVSMGTINTVENLFSVDLHVDLNVFKFTKLTHCLQFFEDVEKIYQGRFINKNNNTIDNVTVENCGQYQNYYDGSTYLGTTEDNDGFNYRFSIIDFSFKLYSPEDVKSFVKVYKNYLKSYGDKRKPFYA